MTWGCQADGSHSYRWCVVHLLGVIKSISDASPERIRGRFELPDAKRAPDIGDHLFFPPHGDEGAMTATVQTVLWNYDGTRVTVILQTAHLPDSVMEYVRSAQRWTREKWDIPPEGLKLHF